MSDLTPEVLEELTRLVALANDDEDRIEKARARFNLAGLMQTHLPALLAAAQRVQELEAERDKLKDNIRVMFEKAADQRLDGYRELGQRCAVAENEADRLRAKVAELDGDPERLDWLGEHLSQSPAELWHLIFGPVGDTAATLRGAIDAARQAGTEEG